MELEDRPAMVIDIGEMTCFATAEDGSAIRMDMEDSAGRPVSLSLPIECLNRMMMTLPGMVTKAVQLRHKDPSLRIVYPVARADMELGGDPGIRILTLATPDGFSVSFGLSEQQCRAIGGTEPWTDAVSCLRQWIN